MVIWNELIEGSSFLLNELFLDGVGDGQVDFQNLLHQHIDHLFFITLVVLLNLADLLLGLLLEVRFELLIGFLMIKKGCTSAFNFSNYSSFSLRNLATSFSATSRASFSFLCLHYQQREEK